jgi:hypothetical protein
MSQWNGIISNRNPIKYATANKKSIGACLDFVLQMKKQSYQSAKKRITSELANVLKDSSVVIVSDWLKVRGTLRDWTKLWAILKPGLMLLYRNPPSKVCQRHH